MLRKWDDLPENMRNESVRSYYNLLYKKQGSLFVKRIFDILAAIVIFVVLSPMFFIISVAIKLDSKGPIMFRQVRVTQYGKQFKIFKFRTMVNNADKIGTQVTTKNDKRITGVGRILRKFRLDEFPQLFNIILGDMSFVGTRPEVEKYVKYYTDEMMATLLLPAGVTSEASINYKDEEFLLSSSLKADETYINTVMPEKMKYNLRSIKNFNFYNEIKVMVKTVAAVLEKSEEVSNSKMIINHEKDFT